MSLYVLKHKQNLLLKSILILSFEILKKNQFDDFLPNSYSDNQNHTKVSGSNVLVSQNNNQLRTMDSNSKSDLNSLLKNQQFIRTPGRQKQVLQNFNQQSNSSNFEFTADLTENKFQNSSNTNNQRPFDISTTVTSIVDNWEADLAKQVKRRPSGQFESCKY